MRIEERARQAAESARFRLGLRGGRVDVFDAIRQLGIHLLRWPLPDDSLEGAFARRGAMEFILVNSASGVWLSRQRFTAAHELGHRFLSDERDAAWFEASIDNTDDVEANRFAAYFLMDEPTVRAGVSYSEPPMARALNTAAEFEVSLAAAAIHLRALGLIAPSDVDAILEERAETSLRQLAARYKARQPVARQDPVRDPGSDYKNVLQELLRDGLISAERERSMLALT